MILDPILLAKRVHIDLRGGIGDLVQQAGEAIGDRQVTRGLACSLGRSLGQVVVDVSVPAASAPACP